MCEIGIGIIYYGRSAISDWEMANKSEISSDCHVVSVFPLWSPCIWDGEKIAKEGFAIGERCVWFKERQFKWELLNYFSWINGGGPGEHKGIDGCWMMVIGWIIDWRAIVEECIKFDETHFHPSCAINLYLFFRLGPEKVLLIKNDALPGTWWDLVVDRTHPGRPIISLNGKGAVLSPTRRW